MNGRESAVAVTRPGPSPAIQSAEEWLPTVAVMTLGAGVTALLAGVGLGAVPLALAGGAAAGLGLVILLAGEWLDPLLVLGLSLPWPALYASQDLRLAAAAPVTALVLAAWVAGWPRRPGPVRLGRVPVPMLGVFLGIYALAGLLGEHRGTAAREVANLASLLLLLLAATDLIRRKPRRVDALVRVIAVVAGITGGLAVLETVGLLPARFPDAGHLNRAALGFGQPNGLGMFLAISLPFVVHLRRLATTSVGRLGAAVAIAATVAGLLGTFSRGSWLSVLAGAVVLPLAGGWRFTLRVWLGALIAALVADEAGNGVIRETALGLFNDWSIAQRAALMLAGLEMFLQDPVLGVGPGGFALELDRIGARVPDLWDLKPTPHNAYIQMAAEAGVAGLAAFVALLGMLLARALRLARSPSVDPGEASLRLTVLWALAVVCAEGMVEWPLSHGHGQLVILIGALACALPMGVDVEPGAGLPRDANRVPDGVVGR